MFSNYYYNFLNIVNTLLIYLYLIFICVLYLFISYYWFRDQNCTEENDEECECGKHLNTGREFFCFKN